MCDFEIRRPLFPPHYMAIIAIAAIMEAFVILASFGLLKANFSYVASWKLARRWHRKNYAMRDVTPAGETK